VITWARPDILAAPSADAGASTSPPPASPSTAAPAARRPPLGPALLDRLDSDTARSANAERGLLGLLEEAIRVRIVDILERVEHPGRDR
ncbi:MAG TPA: hypothetical protein VF112_01595, partial [Candidatus Dormibacteraeota bacterium]